MSSENVRRFNEKLRTDSAFLNSAKQYLEESSDGSRKHKISEFAKINGLDFSPEDLMKFSDTGSGNSDANKPSAVRLPALKPRFNGSQSQNRKSESFFIWLSGASPEILADCPESETKWQSALGATVLIPTLFSLMACAFVLYSISTPAEFIVPVALAWAFIILTMDRAILAGYRSNLSFFKKLTQFVLRFLIAALIGLSISHPLVLMVFNESIQSLSGENREIKIAELKEKHKQESIVLETQIDRERERLNSIRNTPIQPYPAESPGISDGYTHFQEEIGKLEKDKERFQNQIKSIKEEVKILENKSVDEKNGKSGGGLTGKAGEGIVYQRIMNQISEKNAEIKQIESRIIALEARIAKEKDARLVTIKTEAESLFRSREEYKIKCQEWTSSQTAERYRLVDLTEKALAQLNEQKQNNLESLESQIAEIRSKDRLDILTQTLLLHKIFKGEGGHVALITFAVITLLLMMVDTMPLILKFSSNGRIYDRKISTSEFEADVSDRLYREVYDKLAPEINEYRLSYKQLADYTEIRLQFMSEFLQRIKQETENTGQIQSESYRKRHENDLNRLADSVYGEILRQTDKFFANCKNRQPAGAQAI